MKTKYMIMVFVLTVSVAVLLAPEIESYIPPTNAIARIGSNDTTYSTVGGYFNATSSDSFLWIVSDGSILIEFINYTGGVQ